ncbi:glycosyltransferase [Candidatus Babeliales bacterium]|nr:glycosyltransferase [Candidatus Babeliales bacterium]
MKKLILLVLFFMAIAECFSSNQHVAKPAMKILFFLQKFPYNNQVFINNQISGLIDRGHDVKIYAEKVGDSTMPRVINKYNFDQRVFYGDIPANESDFDIVLCQFGTSASSCLSYFNRGLSGKLCIFFRGYDLTGLPSRYPNFYDKAFAKASLLLPVCESFADRLRILEAPAEKIVILHSAIDCNMFAFRERTFPKEGPVNIVSTSRLVEKKGIDYAIRAVAALHKTHPNIHYSIIGDGYLRIRLEKLVKELGAEEYISFKGWQPSEQVARILDQSHIFILPSIVAFNNEEGIPNALKEAMAMGLPVVSTYHSGIPELVEHGISGFLAPEKDVAALSEHISYLVKNPDLWPAIGRAGRAKIEQEYEMNKENDKLEKILYSLVQGEE